MNAEHLSASSRHTLVSSDDERSLGASVLPCANPTGLTNLPVTFFRVGRATQEIEISHAKANRCKLRTNLLITIDGRHAAATPIRTKRPRPQPASTLDARPRLRRDIFSAQIISPECRGRERKAFTSGGVRAYASIVERCLNFGGCVALSVVAAA